MPSQHLAPDIVQISQKFKEDAPTLEGEVVYHWKYFRDITSFSLPFHGCYIQIRAKRGMSRYYPADRHARYLLQPIDWHSQDWILVVEVLCWFASDELIGDTDAEYAHWLVDGIAAQHGLEASELFVRPIGTRETSI